MSNDLKQSAKCDICNKTFTAKNAAILARSIGVHKRASHGIKGKGKSYYVKVADRAAAQDALDNPVECPFCPKRTKNRSGMSSHMKTNHPEHFPMWTQNSFKRSSSNKHMLELEPNPVDEELASVPTPVEIKAMKHRAYQRRWYKQNKRRSHHRQPEAPAQNGTQSAPHAPVFVPQKMNVVICPKCHCRFATMVIEEGDLHA